MSIWLVYDCYIFASIALFGTIAAAVALLWIATHGHCCVLLRGCTGVEPPLVGVLGMLFGLALVFLANDTWAAHDRAITAAYREAEGLRSITVMAAQLPPAEAGRVRSAALAYARAATAEWPLLAYRTTSPDAASASDRLLAAVSDAGVLAHSGPVLGQQEIAEALAIRNGREARITLAQTHVNPLKWAVMAFLGFVTMLTLALVHIERPRAMVIAVGLFALASAPTATVVLIHGNPFQRPLAVTAEPLRDAIPDDDTLASLHPSPPDG